MRYRPRPSGPVLSGLRTKATGRAPTAGCRVVKSKTSEPAGVIGLPSDAGWFVTVMSADEETSAEAAATATTKSASAARRAGAPRVESFIGRLLSEIFDFRFLICDL